MNQSRNKRCRFRNRFCSQYSSVASTCIFIIDNLSSSFCIELTRKIDPSKQTKVVDRMSLSRVSHSQPLPSMYFMYYVKGYRKYKVQSRRVTFSRILFWFNFYLLNTISRAKNFFLKGHILLTFSTWQK